MGEAAYKVCEIRVQRIGVAPQRQAQVFLHELVHCILYEMVSDLRTNEVFVDTFSSLLHQALTSAEYKIPEITP